MLSGIETRLARVWLRTALLVVAVLIHVYGSDRVQAEDAATATGASLVGDSYRTTFQLTLSAGVTAELYTLAKPYRVIVDLPDVGFALPDGSGQSGRGLVRAFRYGLFAERKARVVIDTEGPVRIERAGMTRAGEGVVFSFDLVTTDPQSFGLGTGAGKQEAEAPKADTSPPPASTPKQPGKAVIMIDPGHGGIDAGAIGASKLLEKNVVLAVGKELGRQLAATGRYDVHMTRASDIFISLDQRLNLSMRRNVDLFISLHADSLAEANVAQSIRGATIYTLSERASDEHARRMAEKENASDLIAGLNVSEATGDDEVRTILFDLMKRETANFSADFSNVLVRKLRDATKLSRAPQRSAAFKVLKQTHAPSVLIELGYLSNTDDEKLLGSPAWHKKMAASITASVDTYFAKRTAGGANP